MEKDLEKYLMLLNGETCLKKPKEAVVVLEKITKCFRHESSQFTLGILTSMLLDERDAIFTFIRRTSAQFETVQCVSAAFKLLEYLVTEFEKSTQPYFPLVYQKCVHLLDAKFAKVKELSLRLIKTLIGADSEHTLDLSKPVAKLEKYLREETKIPGTVIDQIYSLLGYLFEKHPESVPNDRWLLCKMLETLQQESTPGKNPTLGSVKGVFEGINGYLTNHPPPDAETMGKTYEHIKKWCRFQAERKLVSRAGLNILQNHWRQFSGFIYSDREFWKVNMEVWISQKGEDRKMACKFLCSFYSVIALHSKQESNSEEVKIFIGELAALLASNCSSREKKAALVGIKLFVLTCSLPADDFNETYDRVRRFIRREEKCQNATYGAHSVECLSAFVLRHPGESVCSEQLALLQRLSVKLIENYPRLEAELQSNVAVALEKSFYMMGVRNFRTAEDHIDRVVYQGLIRTSSSLTRAEWELLIETGQTPESVRCDSYLSFWKHLLTLSETPNLPVDGSFPLKRGVAARVFDAFFRSFLEIVSKLNFYVGPDLEVSTPSDFRIFINLADLYGNLIGSVDPGNLRRWLLEIFRTTIRLSQKNPLLSGFYKIIEVTLRAADDFFAEEGEEKETRAGVLGSVRTFLEWILTRVDHYKGDLQVACLKVLLAAPVGVIGELAEKAIPGLEVITQHARGSFPLLKDLVEALERWDLHLPPETSRKILKRVLPLLDVFFQSPYFRGRNAVDSSKGGKKLKVEVVFDDSEFLALQKKFLMFLGNLEIGKGLHLIELSETEERRRISDKHLVYSLPCGSGWVDLNLDEMVLRVVDLAESSADRRTRVTACELLHSIVLILVGNVSQMTGGYTYLFRRLARSCLFLASDPDGLVRQIFEPLMYQLARYFSSLQAARFSETDDLLEILMECVTCPRNPTARDFAGELLREFTAWSIKELPPEEANTTPEAVRRILERIYAFALHPSYGKRLGAAVVFNRIYSVLREEDFILNAYWFQLLYYFMESLRMCEETDEVGEIIEAIGHVERPLVERRKEFNQDSPERIVPPEFHGGRLCHLVRWAMELACNVNPATRRTAMSLVHELAPLVENCDSNMPFSSKQLQNFFQLKARPVDGDDDDDDDRFTDWLRHQTAGFEYCAWLLEENVLKTDEVFQPKFKRVLKQFIKDVTSHRKRSADLDGHKQEAVLAFLSLLYTLRERVCLYPPEHWVLLRTAVFKPTLLGFDPDRSDRLLTVLVDLLRHFSSHLTQYDWNDFYANLQAVVTVPVFRLVARRKSAAADSREFLFALRVMQGSGVWSVFMENVFHSMNEDAFLPPIFNSLFVRRRGEVLAVPPEPSSKSYLEEVLEVMLKMSTDLKGMMKWLGNEEEVREEETGKTVKKGEFFQSQFQSAILSSLEGKQNQLIDWVLKQKTVKGLRLLLRVLESQTEDSDLPLEVFLRWQDFECLEVGPEKDGVLLRVAVSGARIIGTPGFLKTSPVADKIYAILASKNLKEVNFSELQSIVSLLPFLSAFGEGPNENDRLRECLFGIQIGPSQSENFDFVVGGILQSLKWSASLVLLDFVLTRTTLFKAEDVESALEAFSEGRSSVALSTAALELAYSHCFDRENPSVPPSTIHKTVLGPLTWIVPPVSVYKLVNKHVEALSRLISTYWGEEKTPMEILTDMSRKISAAELLRTFVTRLTREELDQMPKPRRQILDTTVKNVFFFLKKPYPPRVLKERYRKLMCEIFNMICCIVSARCVEEKFYKLFIFDDRGSFLFEAIDKTAAYNFDMDFEEIPKRRKHLTILRETIAGFDDPEPVKYLQTNTLLTSSLREDVTRFDLTSAFIRPADSIPCESRNVEIELEMDSLNDHECMATLVATISKMVRDKITPLDDVEKPPSWLKFLMSILRNWDLNENLRLFALKAIYNVQEFVGPFARVVFPDLVEAVLKVFASHPMNYFLLDLVEMMAGWRQVPDSDRSRIHLTELVDTILEKSDSLRRDIVRHNLDVLKVVIEVWKTGMCLPLLSSSVFGRLSKSVAEDSRTRRDGATYLNVHACGILLSNGIPAWEEGGEGRFLELVVSSFRNENKLNQAFGEVCGQALNLIRRTRPEAVGEYERTVREKVDSLPGCWLQVLYGIHRHYPRMSSFFTFRIFSSAWDSMDSLTVKKLEMLLGHVSGSEPGEDETFDRHANAFILDMLNSPDAEVLELSLRIAEKLLHKLEGEKLRVFARMVAWLQRSVHPGVRKWVYEIGKELYRRGRDGVAFSDSKVILLRGLSDPEKELEDSCLEFWRGVLDVTSPDGALPVILDEMYTPDTEDVFLNNAARVLLGLADEYTRKREIFPHPIAHRCKFRNRNLILGVRQSSLVSLPPLTNRSLENVATIKGQTLPYLRPTPDGLKFQPTVGEEESVASTVPKNPEKRRFYKNEGRHLNRTMGTLDSVQMVDMEIHGEYRDGDYPDIQIRHGQVAKLLEVLSKRDHQIARLFLVSFYSGLIRSVGDEQRRVLLSKTRDSFEEMLKSSGNFDPGVFGFLLRAVLDHGLDVDYQLVSNAAVSSNWIALGALILEQSIAAAEEEEAGVPAKRRRGCEQPREGRWLELAKLYRSLEEFDVVSGIFLDKLNVVGDAREALQRESVRDWAGASRHYESVLRSEPNADQAEFYTESYLSCLAKLSNWSAVNDCIRATVSGDLGELWNNYHLLSWFLKSEMMLSLGTDRNEFRSVLEEFCGNAAKRDILGANFGEEMTVFDWFSGNLQRANHRIDRLCLDFLAGWSHLDRWACNLRAARLASLQTLSELEFAVRNLSEGRKSRAEENIRTGVKRWKKNVPTTRDELAVWDLKLGYRREFLNRLKDPDLAVMGVRGDLSLARAALGQENLNLAKECLTRAKEKLPEGHFDLRADHNICFNMGKMSVAKSKMADANVGLNVYLNVWNGIARQVSSAMDADSESVKTLTYSCNFALGQLVSEILPFARNRTAPPEILQSLSRRLNTTEENVPNALQETGLAYFESAIAALETANCSPETKSNAYLELAKFLLKFSGDFDRLAGYLLKSMRLGNPDARELFGCLLNVSHLLPDGSSPSGEVLEESDRVPSWMYLPWLDQMLARLNSNLFVLLKRILGRIANEHPNAIRYPLKLMAETRSDSKAGPFLSSLLGIITQDRLYEDFWTAVGYLAPPEVILGHYLGEALEEASRPDPDLEEVREMISRLKRMMFSGDYAKFRGPVFKFWDAFEAPLGDLTEFDNPETVKKKIADILSSVQSSRSPSKRALGLLESYSPWLHGFHALKVDGRIELPGRCEGRPAKHPVTVSSFKNAVLLFDSKCRPIRVTVLGNDAREHKFLVKFGEDLRQDERIQKVFRHFNNRLEESRETREFRLDTYAVFPFTTCVGLIEWVENHVSLLEMVENALGDESEEIGKAQSAHLAFLSGGPDRGTVAGHLIGYESAKRDKAVAHFRATARRFPPDLLKKSLLDLSTSPEHFVHLRGNFATSHATASVTHWLVGIGDRHLQNILVSTRTGRVLGIDFGYAFGFATQFLTPPELVPFRLSPQILNVMHPLGESGRIKQTMAHCLRVFRRESFRLRSVLGVFAEEPVMNWLKQVKRNPNYAADSECWHPGEKVSLVERKLAGANPVAAAEADLRAGHRLSKHLGKYLEVLRGLRRDNVRARCPADGLTEEEQVECLIDLATDPHVLAKTYVGWNPWL